MTPIFVLIDVVAAYSIHKRVPDSGKRNQHCISPAALSADRHRRDIPLISGNVDLASAACGAASGVLVAVLVREGLPCYPAVLLCLLMGAVVGAVNAVLTNYLICSHLSRLWPWRRSARERLICSAKAGPSR